MRRVPKGDVAYAAAARVDFGKSSRRFTYKNEPEGRRRDHMAEWCAQCACGQHRVGVRGQCCVLHACVCRVRRGCMVCMGVRGGSRGEKKHAKQVATIRCGSGLIGGRFYVCIECHKLQLRVDKGVFQTACICICEQLLVQSNNETQTALRELKQRPLTSGTVQGRPNVVNCRQRRPTGLLVRAKWSTPNRQHCSAACRVQRRTPWRRAQFHSAVLAWRTFMRAPRQQLPRHKRPR